MKTLNQLAKKLNTEVRSKKIKNVLELLDPFSNYAGQDWKTYFESDKDEFQYSVIHKDEHLKLVLIYWNAFKKSDKHGHMKGGGLMKVLSGQVVETRFDPEEQEKVIGVYNCKEGDLNYIHDDLAVHIVENPVEEPAVSLHVYCSGKVA